MCDCACVLCIVCTTIEMNFLKRSSTRKWYRKKKFHLFSIGMLCAQSFNSLSLLIFGLLIFSLMTLKTCTLYSLQRLTMSSNLDSIIGFHFVHNSSNKSDHHRWDTKESSIGWKTMKRKEIDKESWLNLCLCVCKWYLSVYTSTVFAGQTPKAFHPFDDFQFGWKIYMLLYSLVMLQRTREFSRFYVVSRRKSFLARLLLYYPFSSIHFRFDSVNNFLFGRLPHEVATLMDSHWIYSSVWLLLHAHYSDDHLGETFFGDERERVSE